MNEEEKKVVELLEHCQNTYIEDTLVTHLQLTTKEVKILLNLVDKQQKEIEARLKEIDSLYKMMSVKDDEIEKLKEDYQILKDDIEGHNIIYLDTPEFEEKYISKNEIRHIRDKAECMDYYSLNDVIDDLSKLLGENEDE